MLNEKTLIHHLSSVFENYIHGTQRKKASAKLSSTIKNKVRTNKWMN